METEAEEVLFTRLQIEISIPIDYRYTRKFLAKNGETVAAVTATAKVRLILN